MKLKSLEQIHPPTCHDNLINQSKKRKKSKYLLSKMIKQYFSQKQVTNTKSKKTL